MGNGPPFNRWFYAAFGGANAHRDSANPEQSSESGSDTLLREVLAEVTSAPFPGSAGIAVERAHAMPGEGAAQVAPGHTEPVQKPAAELQLASQVVQARRSAGRPGQWPGEAE